MPRYWLGKKLSEQHKKNIGKGLLGHRHSEESKKKMSKLAWKRIKKGKQKIWLKGHKVSEEVRKKLSGINNYLWKGEKASYFSKHIWVNHWKGSPKICEICGTTTAKRYEWANISGEYKRDLNDYIRLCASCHRNFDMTDEKRKKLILNFKGAIGIREKYQRIKKIKRR